MEDIDSDSDSDPVYARGYDSPTDGDDLNLNFEPDPFYDELADDHNERWVRDNLSSRTTRKTDAVLNCPSCFSVLSVDCQRHAYYENQFRAMFVSNCRVVLNHSIRYRVAEFQRSKSTDQLPNVIDSRAVASEVLAAVVAMPAEHWELFHPVHCLGCEVEVAVYEPSTELFHFHNVFVSY